MSLEDGRAGSGRDGLVRLVVDSCASRRRRRPELEETAQLVGTPPVRAAAALAAGTVEIAAGRPEIARVLLEDAVDLFAGCGAPWESARARLALAEALAAVGRAEAAAHEAGAARAALDRLAAAARAAPNDAGAGGTPAPNGLTPRETSSQRG
ncbi:MAG TPA: hypothetical protein VG474_01880 [Solirubrobacteraceae bacterium]|nr:hypothetical protein [Solirubrobacteraceae bacterium]